MQQQNPPVVLSGHNIKSFDCPLLMNALESTGKTAEILQCISGFLNTKKLLFRNAFSGLSSYSLSELITYVTGSDYGAHDALEDVLALQRLVKDSDIDISESICRNSRTTGTNPHQSVPSVTSQHVASSQTGTSVEMYRII